MAPFVPTTNPLRSSQKAHLSIMQDGVSFVSLCRRARRKGGLCSALAAVFLSAAFSLTLVSDARAGDLVFGIGRDNVDEANASEATNFQFEYHTSPVRSYSWGTVAGMGVVEYDDDEDFYVGLGLSVLWDATSNIFVEGSLAAGYYDAGGDRPDLGGDVQFRSLIGVGYRISEVSRVSIAIDHLSNAGLEDVNPGRNAVMLRYARSF